MNWALRGCLLVPAIMCAADVFGAAMTIQLRSGGEIAAEVLDQRDDRVVVDLGFTVLSIPAKEIEKIVPRAAAEVSTTSTTDSGGLFHTDGTSRPTSVQENAAHFGAAVVQIRTPVGLGSGFIIHPDGYVVTNEHVIAGEYQINLTVFERQGASMEKTQFNNVRIVALDPRLDLALLKIEDAGSRTFTTVPIGDSGALEGGETVFAIGSPLGLERTVSQGIISLKNRPLSGQLYIQTTTQINPGNSGGPLFNLRGEIVGVNNMKAMAVGVEGVNFAIPANVLKDFLRNRDAFAYDTRNPNAGFRYLGPPQPARKP